MNVTDPTSPEPQLLCNSCTICRDRSLRRRQNGIGDCACKRNKVRATTSTHHTVYSMQDKSSIDTRPNLGARMIVTVVSVAVAVSERHSTWDAIGKRKSNIFAGRRAF